MLASVLRANAYFPKNELLHDHQHVGFRALIGFVRSSWCPRVSGFGDAGVYLYSVGFWEEQVAVCSSIALNCMS